MGYTILERLLETDRVRRRASPSGGFSVPVMHERSVPPEVAPVLVTTTRGQLVPSHRFPGGFIRCGVFPCPIASEAALFGYLHQFIAKLSETPGWPTRCTSIQAARVQMEQSGRRVRSIVISKEDLASLGVNLETAEKLMALQGYVAIHDRVQSLMADLPAGHGLVVAADAGTYVRIDEYLGLMLHNVNSSFIAVIP